METLDISQTQRILFLIDLHPLLHLQIPDPYISTVRSATSKLLKFPPLSSSLFAFKFFFSSLSPLLSTSKLHPLLGKSAAFFAFDSPSQTLISLSSTLNSLSAISQSDIERISSPRAFLLARSLLQITHDYAWEPPDLDNKRDAFFAVRSNQVVLFSPLSQSLRCLSQFVDLEIEGNDVFCREFFTIFSSVKEGCVNRDMHLCWIDVIYDKFGDERVEELELGLVEKGVKGLGWGFCSTDAIILGSALVPFGLIYPLIGFSVVSNKPSVSHAKLSLEISDVNGKPLECVLCDLELLNLNLSKRTSANLSRSSKFADPDPVCCSGVNCLRSNGISSIRVKEVWKNDDVAKIKYGVCDVILLRRLSGECGKDQKMEISEAFFADRVLEMLQMEKNEFIAGKPIWQLLMTFLYRRNYNALVSVSDGDKRSAIGILEPLTVHSAILCIMDSVVIQDNPKLCFDSVASNLHQLVSKTDDEIPIVSGNLNCSNMFTVSQSVEGKRRNRKHMDLLQDLSWSSFSKAVLSHPSEVMAIDIDFTVDLEEVYFASRCSNSKKLRFLKCWMKQIKKLNGHRRIILNEMKAQREFNEETEEDGGVALQQEAIQLISSSLSIGEIPFSGSTNSEIPSGSSLETSESFFGSIPQKIQQSLDNEEADLGVLAERLVNASIHWLYVATKRNTLENLDHNELAEISCAMVAAELGKLLLQKPRDLIAKYKGCNPYTTGNKVREHELQILFRMEILQSKVGVGIEETAKQKMMKEICLLLENIEFNLQGGIFGGQSLIEFAGKIIKKRYAHSLEDIVFRIYEKMEFLSFDKDGDASESLNDSEESTRQSKGAKEVNDICRETIGITIDKNTLSSEDESPNLLKNDTKEAQKFQDNVDKRLLMEARERRERARRFSSFTSWVPDLQRVWAPKQPKVAVLKPESLRKPTERRKRRGGHDDVVYETPMTGMERLRGRQGDVKDGKRANYGSDSCGSVSKALFCSDADDRTDKIA